MELRKVELRKVYVTKRTSFEAAHRLIDYDGKCSHLHGHSYKVEATFSGYINADPELIRPATECMVCDFSYLKTALKNAVGHLDHANLNDYYAQPTAEIMVVNIFDRIKEFIGDSDYKVESVKLWETEDSYAEYKGEVI